MASQLAAGCSVVRGHFESLPAKVQDYVADKVKLCQPDNVYICDGSKEENESLINELIEAGVLTKLTKYENWYVEILASNFSYEFFWHFLSNLLYPCWGHDFRPWFLQFVILVWQCYMNCCHFSTLGDHQRENVNFNFYFTVSWRVLIHATWHVWNLKHTFVQRRKENQFLQQKMELKAS